MAGQGVDVCRSPTSDVTVPRIAARADTEAVRSGAVQMLLRWLLAAIRPPLIWFAAPPLMHGAAQWSVMSALHHGWTVVLHDDAVPFDAATILATVANERASVLTIVGDAYARPLVDEMRARIRNSCNDHQRPADSTRVRTGRSLIGRTVALTLSCVHRAL